MVKNLIDKLVEMDSVDMAEKAGIAINDENFLGFVATANQEKNKLLKSVGDTYYGISWDKFKEMIESIGFKNGLNYTVYYDGLENEANEAVLYYSDDGMIIFATSFGNSTRKGLNSGKLYGQFRFDGERYNDAFHEFYDIGYGVGGGASSNFDNVIQFDVDVREGLMNYINKIRNTKVLELLPVWKDKQFIWLLDSNDEHSSGNHQQYDIVNRTKINMACKEIKNILQVYLKH